MRNLIKKKYLCQKRNLYFTGLISIIMFGIFCFAKNSEASVIWGDHFDSEPDFVCTTAQEPASLLTGIEGGKYYEDCSCNHTSNTEIGIENNSKHGNSGKGLRYRFDNSGDATQTCQLRVHDSGAYPHFFWGFWMKIPDHPIGGADGNLKLSRFYANGSSIIPGINLATGEFNLFWQGAGRLGWSSWPKIDLYTVPDSGWHYYIQEFGSGQAGDGDNDYFDGTGIYRMWIDGELELERINIDWGVSGTPFSWAGGYLSEQVENLNGNYNGGLHDVNFDDVIWATTKEEIDDFLETGPNITNVSGTLAHGNTITISGSGFGIKAAAEPHIWETLEDGNVDLYATIGSWNSNGGIGNLTASSSIVRPHRTLSAFADINSDNISACFDAGPAVASKWFVSFWFYLGSNFSFNNCKNDKFYRFAVPGLPSETTTACFQDGYDMHLNNEYMAGIVPSTTYYQGAYSDQWVPPVVGSTETVEELYGRPKPSWIDPTFIGWRFTNDINIQKWHQMAYEYEEGTLNNYDGHTKIWFDGKLIVDKNILTRSTGYDHDKRPKHIGFYHSGSTGGTSNYFYINDVYVDSAFSRVEIGNASTYNSCTHREIQPLTAWNSNGQSITVTVNQGSFENTNNAYLYVVDSEGAVNPIGYKITFGSEGGGMTLPVSPSGLSVS